MHQDNDVAPISPEPDSPEEAALTDPTVTSFQTTHPMVAGGPPNIIDIGYDEQVRRGMIVSQHPESTPPEGPWGAVELIGGWTAQHRGSGATSAFLTKAEVLAVRDALNAQPKATPPQEES